MSEDLKPCPFCGPKEEPYQPNIEGDSGWFTIVCGWCEARIAGEKSQDKAVSEWNTRPSPWIPRKDRGDA